ncbi:hypothetical protein [Stakelama marina]|uniref:Oligosaccharide repeat unit polymerase n=1 Tax=Stakelama marina TaxID=2826939 RepID=A0A8T4IHC9_9SPHN|nr:hypothetical protein [Stakelama marina]MBR0554043.1 hypothetical protein [Stakelama marina]
MADYWSTGAYSRHYGKVSISFFILSIFYFFAILGLPRVSLKNAFSKAVDFKISDSILFFAAAISLLQLIIHFSFTRWDLVWSNTEYQAMALPVHLIIQNSIIEFVSSLSRVIGVICAVFGIYSLRQSKKVLAFVFLAIFFWYTLYQLASHSREATFLLGILSISIYIYFPKQRIISILFALLAVFSLFTALSGRSSGHHGFSSVVELPGLFYDAVRSPEGAEFALMNFFEGVYTFSEHFAAKVEYPTIYKLVCLSPFPGFIDHWPRIRDLYQDKLYLVVPRSALDEVLQFGWIYVVCYFSVQAVAIRVSLRAIARSPGALSLMLNAIVFVALFAQTTYGVRLVFRFFIIAIVGGYAILIFSQRRGQGRNANKAIANQVRGQRTMARPVPVVREA